MIRRHTTPALFLLAALLVSLSARPLLSGRPLVLIAPSVLAAAAGMALLRADPARLRRAGALAVAAGAGFALGACTLLRLDAESSSAGTAFPPERVSSFTGYLTRDSALSREGRTILHLRLTEASSRFVGARASARGGAVVILAGDYRYSVGQVLVFHSVLRALPAPGPESFISFVERAKLRSAGFRSPVWEARARIRTAVHRTMSHAGYPASALLEALLVGGTEDIPAELSDGFRRTGSLHVLALSGLQLVVIYGALSLMLRMTQSRIAELAAGTAVLLFYQFVAGPVPSLLRATVMLTAGSAALLMDRDAEPLNLLSLAGIAILLADPLEAWSLSFQLSFLALAGIILFGPLVSRPLEGLVPPGILGALSASLGAQVATLPVVVLSFGVYYPVGILAGLILVPLTTVFLWLGLAWMLFFPVMGAFFGPATAASAAVHGSAAWVFNALYGMISRSAGFFGSAPGIMIGPGLAPWIAALAAAVCAALAFLPPWRPSPSLRGLRPGAPFHVESRTASAGGRP